VNGASERYSVGLPIRFAVALLLALCASPLANAVELHLSFGALERMLAEQVFTQEGRRYVRGDKSNRCNFAYLESPRVGAEAGKLRIRARFSGRSSVNMLGQCVGLGDAFNVVIDARPQYKGGAIRLTDVVASSDGKTGFYIRRVCTALQVSLARDFAYPLENTARDLLENAGAQPGYKREMRKFNVPEIRIAQDAIVLVLDFELLVK
jgi:hypothetical protein